MRVKKSESKREKQCEKSKRGKEKDIVRQKEMKVDGKGERRLNMIEMTYE